MSNFIDTTDVFVNNEASDCRFLTGKTVTNSFIMATIGLTLLIVTFKDSLTSCYPYRMDVRIRYIDDLFIVVLYLIMILDGIVSRNFDRGIRRMNFILAAVFLWAIFQTWFLHLSFLTNSPVFLIRDNLWYYPGFYFVAKYFTQYKKLFLTGAYCFIWAQIVWYFMAFPLHFAKTGMPLISDAVQGTLGQGMANVLGYCVLLFLPLLYVQKKYFQLGMTVIIFLATSSRSSMILCFFIAVAMVLFRAKFKQKIIYLAIIAGVSLPPYYLYNTYTSNRLYLSSIYEQQLLELKPGHQGAARITFFLYSMKKIRTAQDFIMGRGIATYSSRMGFRLKGPLYKEYEVDFPFQNSFVTGGSTLNHWIVEYGIIASLLLLSLMLGGIILIRKNPFAVVVYLVCLAGLAQGKLMEMYGVAFFWFYLLGIYYGMIKEGSAGEIVKIPLTPANLPIKTAC
jgi:hypothetical protein